MTEVRRQPFRNDVQGLRAIAVGLVVLYHAGLPWLPGGYIGVDVFFVISGFLITNHLLSELTGTGRVRLAAFYARRARRILPASVVVLLLTLLASVLWLPRLQLRSTFEQAFATAVYLPNVLFAHTGTDYLADTTPSVYQHYWSLGIEEQFYLVWPVVLIALYGLVRRSQRGLAAGTLALVLVSFAACIIITTSSQPDAFFLLHTRAWELGVGALLAISLPLLPSMPRAMGVAGSWAGLAMVLAAGVLYSSSMVFPGYAAALPVLGAALLIAFGATSGPSTRALLSMRGMVTTGTISYSLYLVHWPLLTIPKQAGGYPRELGFATATVLVGASVLAAWLLYRFVEEPAKNAAVFRRGSPRRSRGAARGMTAVAAVAAIVALLTFRFVPLDSGQTVPPQAVERAPSFTDFVPANLDPALGVVETDTPAIYASGCHADFVITDPVGCTYGPEEAPLDVTLFGDSHAAQWFPALGAAAERGELRLTVHTKSSCPSAQIAKYRNGVVYTQCAEWREAVIDENSADPADLVVVANFARSDDISYDRDPAGEWGAGLQSTLDELAAAGSEVAVIADTPRFPGNPSTCLSANLDNAGACAEDRDDVIADDFDDAEAEAAYAAGGTFVDVNDWLCDAEVCGPIIGNRMVYRDFNHITASMSADLSEVLVESISGR